MKRILLAAAVVALMIGAEARAGEPVVASGSGSCSNCSTPAPASVSYGGGGAIGTHGHFAKLHHPTPGYFGGRANKSKLPVYMAAPWYLYWPYDGHFQTVAPMAYGAYYPPPAYTGNPYLPVQNAGYVPGSPIPNFPVAPVR